MPLAQNVSHHETSPWFWILAGSSAPEIFVSSIWHCWWLHLKAKAKGWIPDKRSRE